MRTVIPKIDIIILNTTDTPGFMECLSSLDKVMYENHEVIIVRNGPRDDALEKEARRTHTKISKVIFSGSNAGFSVGNNLGIRQALKDGAEYLLLLNDDTVVSPNFLNILVEYALKSSYIGITGPRIFYFDDPEKIWFAGARIDPEFFNIRTINADRIEDGKIENPIESDYITGCALLISKEVIKSIGLLDERFFLYWEDTDWGLRAKKAGLKNFVIPSAHVWHKVSVSSGGMDSLIRVYHKTRSHLLLAKLHAPDALTKLHIQFIRDIAWLLLKSNDRNRFKKARAYIAAIKDYHKEKTDKGPQWIWHRYDKN